MIDPASVSFGDPFWPPACPSAAYRPSTRAGRRLDRLHRAVARVHGTLQSQLALEHAGDLAGARDLAGVAEIDAAELLEALAPWLALLDAVRPVVGAWQKRRGRLRRRLR